MIGSNSWVIQYSFLSLRPIGCYSWIGPPSRRVPSVVGSWNNGYERSKLQAFHIDEKCGGRCTNTSNQPSARSHTERESVRVSRQSLHPERPMIWFDSIFLWYLNLPPSRLRYRLQVQPCMISTCCVCSADWWSHWSGCKSSRYFNDLPRVSPTPSFMPATPLSESDVPFSQVYSSLQVSNILL